MCAYIYAVARVHKVDLRSEKIEYVYKTKCFTFLMSPQARKHEINVDKIINNWSFGKTGGSY